MSALRQILLYIQMFLAPKRILINRMFFGAEVLLVIINFAIYGNAVAVYNSYFMEVYSIGGKLGEISLILYILTLLPGMITRLQWMPSVTTLVGSIITPFRRHLGILMFITAWMHFSLTTSLPQLIANGFDTSKIELMLFQWMGQIAWWLLMPLWLTSNDTSMKYLGKWWKRVHRLTYIALFLIFFHVALQQANWMYVLGIIIVLQVISWIRVVQRTRTAPVPAPTQTSTNPA